MPPLMLIAFQVCLAAAVLHVLRWHVLLGFKHLPQRGLILDVWAPVAIVLPLLFTVAWIGHSVRGEGWPALGGPVMLGLFAMGAAGVIQQHRAEEAQESRPVLPYLAVIVAIISGLILLLLGAAHVMHILAGQIAFALAAVILWTNTPYLSAHGNTAGDEPRVWTGMVVVVLGSCLMGAAALFIDEPLRALSAAIMLIYGAAALLLAAIYAGPAACMRIGAWAAAVGVLGGMGALSISHMLPQALALLMGQQPADVRWVAYGFGAYAFEAAILLVLPLMMLAIATLPRGGRAIAGVLALIAAAALTVWRLANI